MWRLKYAPHEEVDDGVVEELLGVKARQVSRGDLHRPRAAARREQRLQALHANHCASRHYVSSSSLQTQLNREATNALLLLRREFTLGCLNSKHHTSDCGSDHLII